MMDAESLRFLREEIKRSLNIILTAVAGANEDTQTEIIQNLYAGSPNTEAKPVMHPYGFVSRAAPQTTSVVIRRGDHPASLMILGHRDGDRPAVENGETMLYNLDGQMIYLKTGELIETLKKLTINADGDIKITSTGDLSIEIDGDNSLTVNGDDSITIDGELKLNSTDDLILETKEGNLNLLVDLVGEKLNLVTDSADEPFVLGNTLTQGLTNLNTTLETLVTGLNTFASALAALSPPTLPTLHSELTAPAIALQAVLTATTTQLTTFQTQYLATPATNIVSQKIFGVRGP